MLSMVTLYKPLWFTFQCLDKLNILFNTNHLETSHDIGRLVMKLNCDLQVNQPVTRVTSFCHYHPHVCEPCPYIDNQLLTFGSLTSDHFHSSYYTGSVTLVASRLACTCNNCIPASLNYSLSARDPLFSSLMHER